VIFLLSLVFILSCCKNQYTATGKKWNLSAIYNPASSRIHPAFRVYHNSDNTSLLLVKLFPSELLFTQANIAGEYISKVSIQVQTYEIDSNKILLTDSITYTYNINQKNAEKRFLSQIPVKTEMGKSYQLRIVTRDLLKKDFNLIFVDVDKKSEYSEQNFNVLNPNGIPYFSNVIPKGAVYNIQHRNISYKKLFINYYKNDVQLPKPTYIGGTDDFINHDPDSIYILDYSPNLFIALTYEGLYHFRFDTNQSEGLTIINPGPDFPKIKSPRDMIEPLAYITNSADYNKLIKENNEKLAVDNFWLDIGGTAAHARELIRVYYNRVYFSNYYFTSAKPGWKTDRGMIYIVYGPPQNLHKTPTSETWTYYQKGASNSINFTFLYEPNAFSLDNFVLQHSESQEWHWTEAVNSWRKGNVLLYDEE
jgi:GWxTD domain-containing protein